MTSMSNRFSEAGSVLIEVLNRGFPGRVVAGDFNRDIILCYQMIQSQVEPLIQVLNSRISPSAMPETRSRRTKTLLL